MPIIAAVLISGPVYAKQDKDGALPPGLQKKVQRGGKLPPGWQNKLQKGATMEPEVYQQGTVIKPIDATGVITIKVDDKIIRLMKATREIVDILQ
jgi:hypothetical protein